MWSAQPPYPQAVQIAPFLDLKCILLWFWVWAGFSPQNTTGQLPTCSALRLGLELVPSPLCASFVFGVGVGVLFLSCSGFLEGSEYRAALRYSFQCFMGFFVFLSDFFCLLV